MNLENLVKKLELRIVELSNWIRESGINHNICTYNILKELCSDCRCKRKLKNES